MAVLMCNRGLLPLSLSVLVPEITLLRLFHKPQAGLDHRALCGNGQNWLKMAQDGVGQKRSRPEGRLPYSAVPSGGLEEDHATNLEQIPVVEALVNIPLADIIVQVNVHLKMLIPCIEVHGSGVDLLHNTQAPAVDL